MARIFVLFSLVGVFSMGEVFSFGLPMETCIPCRERLLSKQEFVQNDKDWKQELINIDRKLKALTQRRNLHQVRADRLQEEVDQCEACPDRIADAQSVWKRLEQERALVRQLHMEIETLQHRRLQILKEQYP